VRADGVPTAWRNLGGTGARRATELPATVADDALRGGHGTVWVVADDLNDDFVCYWYEGGTDSRLVEQARAATVDSAMVWGRARTGNVWMRPAVP
jgi:hypothetical protein